MTGFQGAIIVKRVKVLGLAAVVTAFLVVPMVGTASDGLQPDEFRVYTSGEANNYFPDYGFDNESVADTSATVVSDFADEVASLGRLQAKAAKDENSTTGLSSGNGTTVNGFYIGTGLGLVIYSNDKPNLGSDEGNSDLFFKDGSSLNSSIENVLHDAGYKVFAGYNINEHFAVEGAYVKFGRFEADSTFAGTSSFGTATGKLNSDITADGVSLSGLAKFPFLNKNSKAYAKAGLLVWDVDLETEYSLTGTATKSFTFLGNTYAAGAYDTSGIYKADKNGVSMLLGLGTEYDFTDRIAARAEWEFYNNVGKGKTTGQTDIHLVTGNVMYKF